jgi:hypothetical protein
MILQAVIVIPDIVAASADDTIEKHNAISTLRLGERFPERHIARGLTSTWSPGGKLKVLEE